MYFDIYIYVDIYIYIYTYLYKYFDRGPRAQIDLKEPQIHLTRRDFLGSGTPWPNRLVLLTLG